MNNDPIGDAFLPLRDLPCWDVHTWIGGMVILKFGRPRLEIREPSAARPGAPVSVQRNSARRNVYVAGDYELWVHGCWNFFHEGRFVGGGLTDRRQHRALRWISGQKIVRVDANYLTGHTVFEFDLGGRLTSRPFPRGLYEPSERWHLTGPRKERLAFRSDGLYCASRADAPSDAEDEWLPLPAPGLSLQTFP